jgi:exodeoxyribonuclease V alpha subunit
MDTTSIQGKVTHVIYKDEKTRYTVARFRLYELNEKQITITGYFPEFKSDILLNLTGVYLDHPRFGMQFQVQHYHRVLPNEPDSIITFLSSPLFPGIGKKFAEMIVDKWQEDSLNVLKDNPSLLKEIKGYSPKKEEALISGLINYGEDEEAIRFFTTNGLGIRNILRLERAYGKDAYKLVKENPYRLIDEVDGIGFKIADKLALNMGFDWDDPRRLMAGLCAMTMEECMRTGDSYVEEDRLMTLFSTQFNDNSLDFDALLLEAVRSTKLIQIDHRVFHPSQFTSEQYISHSLKEFPYLDLQPVSDEDIHMHLELLQKELNIEYDESQKEAIFTFFHSPFTIMTGGPGTGKSTVIGAMIHLWKRLYPSYSLACAAPTGRASKRLFELNGVESFTIHSLLKWDLESNTFGMDETNPLSIDCLIIDEFSMVDTWLMSHLLKASQQVKKILIVGDKDQLPSVAPGQVLKDLIDSDVFPVISLKHIYRQKEGSDVISLAHQIREKELDFDMFKNDIKWFDCKAVDVKRLVLEVIQQAQIKGYPLQHIQVLAPMYSGLAGIDALNHAIQKFVNPYDENKNELKVGTQVFRENDKILQLKNQPNDDVYNGDIGICIEIVYAREDELKQNRIIVDFDGRIVEYTSETFINITLAYCVSVHKAQGSEYPIVILPVVSEHRFMLQKRLLYTAVTRASKSLILIGSKQLFIQGTTLNEDIPRKTCLLEYLIT